MSFLPLVSSQVDKDLQAQGNLLYLENKVKRLEGDAYYASAEVADPEYGRERLDVAAYRENEILSVRCDCEDYFESQDICKHAWAMLLAAAGQGMLLGKGQTSSLYLTIEDPEGEDDYYDDEDDDDRYRPEPRRRTVTKAPPQLKAPARPKWQRQLEALQKQVSTRTAANARFDHWKTGRQILYVVEMLETAQSKVIYLSVAHRDRKKNGDWAQPRYENFSSDVIRCLPDTDDRNILSLMRGAQTYDPRYHYGSGCRFYVPLELARTLLPMMCATQRAFVRPERNGQLEPLTFDAGAPWFFQLQCTRAGNLFELAGALRRGQETIDPSQLRLVLPGFAFLPGRVVQMVSEEEHPWLDHFRNTPRLKFPAGQKDAWLKELFRLPNLPQLQMPDDFKIEEIRAQPRPRLLVQPSKEYWGSNTIVEGILSFDYGGNVATAAQPGSLFDAEKNLLYRRDNQFETEARGKICQLGFQPRQRYGQPESLELDVKRLPKVVALLLKEGWHVEAHGKLYRQPGKIDIEVTTGIDWFELHGQVKFDDTSVGLPELLQALKKGENTVVLGDGSVGMLPEDWLKKYGLLAGLGQADNGHLKFRRNQAGLLDALLAAQPEARFDLGFARVRDELRRFEGVQPADAPGTFQGELRAYQRDGLGWLHFLNRFGFGGCLADDMGLGKTVQVLALLEARRLEAEKAASSGSDPAAGKRHPTLVVVPKSLVFNWMAEAARFAPKLRVLDHTAVSRLKPGGHFQDYDLILTTYGILRRDALEIKDCRFDYCILDEAQAVKNAKSESAKACRLIQSNHRLAVTGTPVENHLGELWSLFDFLNPGMLGQASVFQLAGAGARNPEPETRALLARALRPFMLRRTKEQVASDLPQKTEQTLFAEMEPEQRKLYDELRNHYRLSLLHKIEQDGIAKSKILILEALLRLRQAACHPGLIDKKRVADPSAKLDLLLPQLLEVQGEGHKALVFSQFTSMLAIVRQRLDQEKIVYEYLDGKTRQRADKVERFQNDPDCKLFLVSLKAGGVGLNLTAAEYVFLLDPWWNPAVEAQAIDRTHRIGQSKPVFAYRLIVKDTVEEKVLELQNKKRALADAILNCDDSLIRTLGREDLELLLS